jgi:hypothetical protein
MGICFPLHCSFISPEFGKLQVFVMHDPKKKKSLSMAFILSGL